VAAAIPPAVVIALMLVWALGLAAHSITLSAALPGLSHRRALLLSLTGSAVANVLPVGGAAGIALNARMTRRWGFSTASFATYTVVTNLWNVLGKVLLPLVLVPMALWLGAEVRQGSTLLVLSAVLVPLLGGCIAWLLFGPSALVRLRRRLGSQSATEPRAPSGRSPIRHRLHDLADRLFDACETVRQRSAGLARARWHRLSLGLVLYLAALMVLLTLCLHATGAAVPLGFILLAFCGERLVTLAAVTPGGLGLAEVSLAAVLMLAPGASAAGVAAGVLLYRLLTFGLEIPVGGALLAAWMWFDRSSGAGTGSGSLKGRLA
jgi:putative heme transporter